jgi:hypothetical protein
MTRTMLLLFLPVLAWAADVTGKWTLHLVRFGEEFAAARIDLERDYKLSANESNVVLGTSIRYEIAEVVDPQVHIVAKVSKAVLATLK